MQLGIKESEEYFNLLIENGFEKMSLIKTITENDLIQIGISKIGHRRAILLAIQSVQK